MLVEFGKINTTMCFYDRENQYYCVMVEFEKLNTACWLSFGNLTLRALFELVNLNPAACWLSQGKSIVHRVV